MSVPALVIDHLSKSYHDAKHLYPAVNDLSLRLDQGEIMALLGPSGCGKTTLLRLIAGFEHPNAGSIRLAGEEIVNTDRSLSPEKRNVGFVFQDYALFPHLTVLENVMFGLHGKNYRRRRQKRERAREVLDLVGLSIFYKRYPHQLSGGQQQRVALARALAPNPSIILLDEPFSNLDAALRENTRAEIKKILTQAQTAALLVTHDQEEALTFADKLAVMRAGKLQQVGNPEKIYNQPTNAFVASFLGTTNLLDGVIKENGILTNLGLLEINKEQKREGQQVKLSLRPEALALQPLLAVSEHPERNVGIKVTVTQRAFKGHDVTYHCTDEQGTNYTVCAPILATHITEMYSHAFYKGDTAWLHVQGQAIMLHN